VIGKVDSRLILGTLTQVISLEEASGTEMLASCGSTDDRFRRVDPKVRSRDARLYLTYENDIASLS